MQDVVASGDRSVPSLVRVQVSDDYTEPLVVVGTDCRADALLLGRIADRGAHGIAALQQLDDAPACNEPGATRYEHCLRHCRLLKLASQVFSCRL